MRLEYLVGPESKEVLKEEKEGRKKGGRERGKGEGRKKIKLNIYCNGR